MENQSKVTAIGLKNALVSTMKIQHPGVLAKSVALSTFTAMSSFDPELLEATVGGGPWMHSHLDLRSVLERGDREYCYVTEAGRYLNHGLFGKDCEQMQREVIGLMDEDLASRGDRRSYGKLKLSEALKIRASPKFFVAPLLTLEITPTTLALAIARDQVREGNKTNENQYTFRNSFLVTLRTLQNGEGAMGVKDTLIFPLATSYVQFLNTLKQHTTHCCIPPSEKPLEYIHDSFAHDNRLDDIEEQYAQEMREHEVRKWQILDKPSGPRNPHARGYTLHDGPWMWRKARMDDSTKWHYISDDFSYQTLLTTIRGSIKNSPCGANIMIMHSSDWEAHNTAKHRRARQAAYDQDYMLHVRGTLDYDIAYPNDGERFSTFLEKQLEMHDDAAERQERLRSKGIHSGITPPSSPKTARLPATLDRIFNRPEPAVDASNPLYNQGVLDQSHHKQRHWSHSFDTTSGSSSVGAFDSQVAIDVAPRHNPAGSGMTTHTQGSQMPLLDWASIGEESAQFSCQVKMDQRFMPGSAQPSQSPIDSQNLSGTASANDRRDSALASDQLDMDQRFMLANPPQSRYAIQSTFGITQGSQCFLPTGVANMSGGHQLLYGTDIAPNLRSDRGSLLHDSLESLGAVDGASCSRGTQPFISRTDGSSGDISAFSGHPLDPEAPVTPSKNNRKKTESPQCSSSSMVHKSSQSKMSKRESSTTEDSQSPDVPQTLGGQDTTRSISGSGGSTKRYRVEAKDDESPGGKKRNPAGKPLIYCPNCSDHWTRFSAPRIANHYSRNHAGVAVPSKRVMLIPRFLGGRDSGAWIDADAGEADESDGGGDGVGGGGWAGEDAIDGY